MKKKMVLVFSVMLFVMLTVLAPMGYAWLSDNGMSSLFGATGHVHKSYFESGDGTKDIVTDDTTGEITAGPFEIKYPIQLYYFSWLQYLGYFNEDENGNDVLDTQYYFRLSADIDMTGYTLPPAGSINYPFLGNFDGGGFTISNLTVKNKNAGQTDSPTQNELAGVDVIGFFGVVGSIGDGGLSYDTAVNSIYNLVLDNVTVKSETDKALIGIAAGYVNGYMDTVGVINSKIELKSGSKRVDYSGVTNLSDYSIVGYCTEDFRDKITIFNVNTSLPEHKTSTEILKGEQGMGGAAWGGSIAMDKVFFRVQQISNSATTNSSYVYERYYINYEGGNEKVIELVTSKKVFFDEDQGGFVFSPRTNSTAYNYLSGGTREYKLKYTYESNATAYYITVKSGNNNNTTNYLTFSGSSITNSTTQNNASKWFFDDGYIYTVYNDLVYYLNGTTSAVSCSLSKSTTWTFSSNKLYFSIDQTDYLLRSGVSPSNS